MYRPRHLSLLKSAVATAFISAVSCFAYAETPEAPQTLLHDKVQQLIRQKVEDGEFASVVIGITDGQRNSFTALICQYHYKLTRFAFVGNQWCLYSNFSYCRRQMTFL